MLNPVRNILKPPIHHQFLRIVANFNTSSAPVHVELTSERYKVNRGDYGSVTSRDVEYFRSVLSPTRVSTEENDLDGHNTDWLKSVRGASKLLLKPKTSQEVSAILKYCNDRNLAVCPQGGNTGLVGGSVPVFDEIVLSTGLMNNIISLDEWSGVLVCEAGCILENLNTYLMDRGYIMPLDLGAKGSCNIGGNVSTNAGGLRLIRYGSLHATVLGIEAVLANGEIVDCLSTCRKDNTGYDLKHLFIGSEGTLGVVTKVAIHCPIKPNSVKLAFIGLPSFENVLKTFKRAKQELGEVLSSCEYIDALSLDSVTTHLKLRNPISSHNFYMVIEVSGSDENHDEEKLTKFLEDVMNDGVVEDGTIATDTSQMLEIWGLRERICESLFHEGYVYVYDLSVPLDSFDQFVQDTRKQAGPDALRVCGYGHLGDGNIHLQITSKEYIPSLTAKIEPYVFDWTSARRGSVSSEHGLGFKKRDYIHYSKSAPAVNLMHQIKRVFDPKNILNPYKVLPDPLKP